jgi:hypothetical protein
MNPEVTPTQASQVSTFGPGGQKYGANLFGGFKLVAAQKVFTFFDIAESSPDIWAKVLTNLKEAGKIGNSMSFVAVQYGPRIVKVDGTETTPAELAALEVFFASSRLELYVGSNNTKIAEYDLAHFLNPITFASAAASASLPANLTGWVSLVGDMEQGFAPNTEISGAVFCNLPNGVPAALGMVDAVNPKFIFKLEMAGMKQTK